MNSYTVHVLQELNGTTINEYVANGKIFAVSWRGGVRHPDLTNLLGAHFKEYQAVNTLVPSHARGAGARNGPGRGKRTVTTENIQVETGGHVGSVQGRAWVAKLIPAGVTLREIK